MLRKLSQKIRRRRPSDEFVSVDAAAHERQAAQRQAKAQPARRSWEPDDEVDFYTNSRLEALSLEPIIAPTLKRMAPTIAAHEALQPPPRRPNIKLEMPPRAWLPPSPDAPDVVLLSAPIPGITVTPAQPMSDPFEQLRQRPVPEVTARPKRPPLRRKAVSYRTQRDLPLRVQAVRRAHQEQFSRRLAQMDPIFAAARRPSAPVYSDLPARAPHPSPYPEVEHLRPARPLLPEHMLRRAQSEAHLHKTQPRTHSHSPPPRDYYIEAAAADWQLPEPGAGMR